MFDSIRKHQRILQFVLLLLILPAFVFFGVSGYQRFLSDDDSVATVSGERITRVEFEQAQRRQLDNLRQILGSEVDSKMLDSEPARNEVLEGLIAQRALLAQARSHKIAVPDEKLRESILSIPGLKKPDGSFDMDRYKALLTAQGLNEAVFESQMRRDLALQAIPESLAQTAIVPKTVLERLIVLQEETREVRELLFKPEQYAAQVKPGPDELKMYYEDNARLFETPENAKVEYLVLSSDALAAQVPIDAGKVKDFYEQNKERYASAELRQASHILLKIDRDASDAVKKAQRAKAEELLKQIKGGADFAALAKSQSQDPGSAPNGGDLGLFAREMMVKPFADATFGLQTGEVSGIVESDFGLHIIKLAAIKPASQRSFDDARPEIEAEFRKREASQEFAKNAEAFSNMVYEQSDSLKPAADKFKLAIQSAAQVGRTGLPDAPAKSPLLNPKLLAALFSTDSIKNHRNTEAVEIAPSTLASARVVEYQPAQRKPFESVEADVRSRVVAQESLKLAAAAGAAKVKELAGGAAAAGFGDAKVVSRNGPPQVPPAAVDPLFRAAVGKLPAYVGADLGPLGYGVYQIAKVIPPTEATIAQRRAQYQQQFGQVMAQQDLNDYLASIKARSDVKKLLSHTAAKAQ